MILFNTANSSYLVTANEDHPQARLVGRGSALLMTGRRFLLPRRHEATANIR